MKVEREEEEEEKERRASRGREGGEIAVDRGVIAILT